MKVKEIIKHLEKTNPDADFEVSVAFDEENYPFLRAFGRYVHEIYGEPGNPTVTMVMSGESNKDFTR